MSQQGGWGGPPQGGAGGPPQQSYGGGPGAGDASTNAYLALALGIICWIGGLALTAIPGAILGKMEIDKIKRGESPAAGLVYAQIGFWSSVIHLIVSTLFIGVFCCFFGGFGMLAAMGGAR